MTTPTIRDALQRLTYWARNMVGRTECTGDHPIADAERALLAQQDEDRFRQALQSIAINTCCDNCQEAARVARATLAGEAFHIVPGTSLREQNMALLVNKLCYRLKRRAEGARNRQAHDVADLAFIEQAQAYLKAERLTSPLRDMGDDESV